MHNNQQINRQNSNDFNLEVKDKKQTTHLQDNNKNKNKITYLQMYYQNKQQVPVNLNLNKTYATNQAIKYGVNRNQYLLDIQKYNCLNSQINNKKNQRNNSNQQNNQIKNQIQIENLNYWDHYKEVQNKKKQYFISGQINNKTETQRPFIKLKGYQDYQIQQKQIKINQKQELQQQNNKLRKKYKKTADQNIKMTKQIQNLKNKIKQRQLLYLLENKSLKQNNIVQIVIKQKNKQIQKLNQKIKKLDSIILKQQKQIKSFQKLKQDCSLLQNLLIQNGKKLSTEKQKSNKLNAKLIKGQQIILKYKQKDEQINIKLNQLSDQNNIFKNQLKQFFNLISQNSIPLSQQWKNLQIKKLKQDKNIKNKKQFNKIQQQKQINKRDNTQFILKELFNTPFFYYLVANIQQKLQQIHKEDSKYQQKYKINIETIPQQLGQKLKELQQSKLLIQKIQQENLVKQKQWCELKKDFQQKIEQAQKQKIKQMEQYKSNMLTLESRVKLLHENLIIKNDIQKIIKEKVQSLQVERERLQKIIKVLQNKIEQLKKERDQIDQIKIVYEKIIEQKNAQLKKNQVLLNKLTEENVKLNKQNNENKDDCVSRQQYLNLLNQKREKQTQFSQIKSTYQQFLKNHQIIIRKCEQQIKKLINLDSQKQSEQHAMQTIHIDISEIQQQDQLSEQSIKDKQNQIDAILKKLRLLIEQNNRIIQIANNEIKLKKDQIEKQKIEIKQKDNKIQKTIKQIQSFIELKKQTQKLNQQLSKLNHQKQQFKKQIQKYDLLIKQKQFYTSALQEAIKSKQNQYQSRLISKQQQFNKKIKQVNDNYKNQIKNLNQLLLYRLNLKQGQINQIKLAKQIQVNRLTQQHSIQLEQKINQITIQKDNQYRSKLQELNKKIKQAQKQINKLQQIKKQQLSKIKLIQHQNIQLNQLLQKKQQQNIKLNNQLSQKQIQIQKIKQIIQHKQAKIRSLKSELKQRQKQIQKLGQSLKQLYDKLNAKTQQLNQNKKLTKDKQNLFKAKQQSIFNQNQAQKMYMIKQKQQQIQLLNQKHQSNLKEIKIIQQQKYQKQILDLQQSHKGQIQKLNLSHAQAIQVVQQKIQSLIQQYTSKQDPKFNQIKQKYQKLLVEYQQCNIQNQQLKDLLQAKTNSLNSCVQFINGEQIKFKIHQQSRLKQHQAQKSQIIRKNNQMIIFYQQKINELNDIKLKLQQENSMRKKSIDQLKQQISLTNDNNLKNLVQKDDQIQQKKQQINQLQLKILQLQKKIQIGQKFFNKVNNLEYKNFIYQQQFYSNQQILWQQPSLQVIDFYTYKSGNQDQKTQIDQRVIIQESMLKEYPFKFIGKIVAKIINPKTKIMEEKFGTGCIIHSNIIISVAHNIFFEQLFQTASQITFYPSFLCKNNQFKQQQGIKVQKIWLNNQYLNMKSRKRQKYDLVFLEVESLAEKFKFNQFMNVSHQYKYAEKNKNDIINITGYSGRYLEKMNVLYTQQKSATTEKDGFLVYNHTTHSGYSGCPLLRKYLNQKNRARYQIIGVHKGTWAHGNYGILLSGYQKNQLQFLGQLLQKYGLQQQLQNIYTPSYEKLLQKNNYLTEQLSQRNNQIQTLENKLKMMITNI